MDVAIFALAEKLELLLVRHVVRQADEAARRLLCRAGVILVAAVVGGCAALHDFLRNPNRTKSRPVRILHFLSESTESQNLGLVSQPIHELGHARNTSAGFSS